MSFSLDDLVCTQNQGPPAVGVVVGVYNPEFYTWASKQKGGKIITDETYYSIYFAEPIHVISLDEIREQFGWLHDQALAYLNSLEKYTYLDYPESCLEPFGV